MFGRLTTPWVDGSFDTFDPIDIVDNEYSRINYEKVLNKLGAYEDAEEQCIKETSFGFKELLHKWKTFTDDVQELLEYRRLEEQGLLLRLPCKVGDIIYLVDFEENDYDEAIIEEIVIGKNGIFINSDCEIGTPLNADYVKLTKEETEQKLASMKGE